MNLNILAAGPTSIYYYVPEIAHTESWHETANLICNIFKNQLYVQPRSLQRVHRITPLKIQRNHPVVANSQSWKENTKSFVLLSSLRKHHTLFLGFEYDGAWKKNRPVNIVNEERREQGN